MYINVRRLSYYLRIKMYCFKHDRRFRSVPRPREDPANDWLFPRQNLSTLFHHTNFQLVSISMQAIKALQKKVARLSKSWYGTECHGCETPLCFSFQIPESVTVANVATVSGIWKLQWWRYRHQVH